MSVPAGTRFIGILPGVDMTERKSAQANSPSNVYTIEDIQDGSVPDTRTITINGTTQDLSANRSWTISTGITVGTTSSTGTNGRVFFQAGGVVQQDANFTFDNALKRLTLKAVGTASTDIPFVVRNSADTTDNFIVNGLGEGYFKSQQAQPYGLTIENTQTSSSSENTLGSRITFVSAGANIGDRAYIHYNNSNGGGSFAGTFIFSSPRGFRMDSPGTYLSDNYRFTTTSAGNHLAFTASGSGNILRLGVAGGGGTSSEIQIANTLSNYSYWRAPNSDVNHAMSWGRTSTEFMRLNQSGWLGIGTGASIGARLDVRAQGALSTDIAFRVRNSADTANIIEQRGDGNIVLNGTPARMTYSSVNNTGSITHHSRADSVVNLKHSFTFFQSGFNDGSQSTAPKLNMICADITSYGINNGFHWYFNNNLNPLDSERAMWLTPKKTLSFFSGTGPDAYTSKADSFELYSADIVGGNASPHFRTENGNIIKIYRETTAVTAAAFVSNTSLIVDDSATYGGYTMGQVVAALKAQGLLA